MGIRGFSGRNYVADVSPYPFIDPDLFGSRHGAEHDTMRVVPERRCRSARRSRLAACRRRGRTFGGRVGLPRDVDRNDPAAPQRRRPATGDYRLAHYRSAETFLRDYPIAGDPMVSISLRRSRARTRSLRDTRSRSKNASRIRITTGAGQCKNNGVQSGELVTGGRRLCPFSRFFFENRLGKTTQQDSAASIRRTAPFMPAVPGQEAIRPTLTPHQRHRSRPSAAAASKT